MLEDSENKPTRISTNRKYQNLSSLFDNLRSGGNNYMAGSTKPITNHPELLKDLELDRVPKIDGLSFEPDRVTLFIGGTKGGSAWHAAETWNLFALVNGRKKWKMILPKWSYMLKPKMFSSLPAVYGFRKFNEKPPPILQNHNQFNHVPHFDFELQSGDAVTVPPWHWHHIVNLDTPSHSPHHLTIGLSLRLDNHIMNLKMNWIFSFCAEFCETIPLFPGARTIFRVARNYFQLKPTISTGVQFRYERNIQ